MLADFVAAAAVSAFPASDRKLNPETIATNGVSGKSHLARASS